MSTDSGPSPFGASPMWASGSEVEVEDVPTQPMRYDGTLHGDGPSAWFQTLPERIQMLVGTRAANQPLFEAMRLAVQAFVDTELKHYHSYKEVVHFISCWSRYSNGEQQNPELNTQMYRAALAVVDVPDSHDQVLSQRLVAFFMEINVGCRVFALVAVATIVVAVVLFVVVLEAGGFAVLGAVFVAQTVLLCGVLNARSDLAYMASKHHELTHNIFRVQRQGKENKKKSAAKKKRSGGGGGSRSSSRVHHTPRPTTVAGTHPLNSNALRELAGSGNEGNTATATTVSIASLSHNPAYNELEKTLNDAQRDLLRQITVDMVQNDSPHTSEDDQLVALDSDNRFELSKSNLAVYSIEFPFFSEVLSLGGTLKGTSSATAVMMHCAVCVVDGVDGRIIVWSDGCEILTGITDEFAVGCMADTILGNMTNATAEATTIRITTLITQTGPLKVRFCVAPVYVDGLAKGLMYVFSRAAAPAASSTQEDRTRSVTEDALAALGDAPDLRMDANSEDTWSSSASSADKYKSAAFKNTVHA